MLTEQRQKKILELLKTKGAVTVMELIEILNASESTVRRDIVALNNAGKLKKIHGGATVIDGKLSTIEEDVTTKLQKNVNEKNRIGRLAAGLIRDNDFVFIDAGTTTEKMVDYITNNKAIYVTNGIAHAKKLIIKGCKAYVIGGELKLSTEAIIGTDGINSLRRYNFTKCFIGTNAVNKEGFSTPDLEEAHLKAMAMKRSETSYILVDSSKFNKRSAVTFAEIDEAVIITDELVDESYEKIATIKIASRR